MNNYNFEALVGQAYSSDMSHRKPVVGITANWAEGDFTLRDCYCRQIEQAGGVAVLLPATDQPDALRTQLDRIDALLLSGGADHNPLWMGEEPSTAIGHVNGMRDKAELLITRLAYNRQMPMLGICRGMQTMAIALGGHVRQDIYTPADGLPAATIRHSQDAGKQEPTHTVSLEQDSTLYNIYGETQLAVNSFHHQAIDHTGQLFRAVATAPDGTIEAMESTCMKQAIGVQWHPEWLGNDGQPIFRWLVNEASCYAGARRLHRRNITLDSHCDTPMFFPQGADFARRDDRLLVDLTKMEDGMEDAVTMVAYLPQPAEGQSFADVSPTGDSSPKDFANDIFDRIERTVEQNAAHMALARCAQDVAANKRAGRKSILLGIENGIALEHDLDNVETFAQRGVTYITLCHNGDNDICDSARGQSTWGGLSAFGQDVVAAMNDCGLLVDLSHAARTSFYDALQLSRTPIVCSHSSCRALCDHPRNLDDDQLKAIAQRGGVVQITLYHGFLRTQGEATINDALAHIDHAVSLIGPEHVGIGTDFDGDGGVKGVADASEIIQLTMGMMRRRYNQADIAAIWGGNWLRLLQLVQDERKRK